MKSCFVLLFVFLLVPLYARNLGSLANVSIFADSVKMELIVPVYAAKTVCGLNLNESQPQKFVPSFESSMEKVKAHMNNHIRIYINGVLHMPDINPPSFEQSGYFIFNLLIKNNISSINNLHITYDFAPDFNHSDKLAMCFYNKINDSTDVSILYLYGNKKTAVWTPEQTKVIAFSKKDMTRYIRLLIILIAAVMVFFRESIFNCHRSVSALKGVTA